MPTADKLTGLKRKGLDMKVEAQEPGRSVRVLYELRELAGAVKHVLSARRRRLVISAFVGEGAIDYLPIPRNTTLICWPQPAGTNPSAVDELVRSGVRVFFSDNLHIKLYYGEGRGAVLTSANLSRNGLGGGLKEIGVLLPPDAVDIDRVLSSITKRKWTRKEHARLARLWDIHTRRNPGAKKSGPRTDSYSKWYASPSRRPWKLGWWDESAEFSNSDIGFAKSKGVFEPDDFISAGGPTTYQEGDWVLTYFLMKQGKQTRVTSPGWLFIDGVTHDANESDGYPYHAVQLRKWRGQGLVPPFRLERDFCRRFARIAEKHLPEMKRMIFPTHRLRKHLLPKR